MQNPKINALAAIVSLAIWIGLLVFAEAESGLLHLPLGLAVVFAARAVVLSDNPDSESA